MVWEDTAAPPREPTTALALGTDIALNAKLVADVRLGYFRYNIITSKYNQNIQLATQLGIPGMNTGDAITGGAPSFQLRGGRQHGSGAGERPKPGTAVWRRPERGPLQLPAHPTRGSVPDRQQLDQNLRQPFHQVRSGSPLCPQPARAQRQRPHRNPLLQQSADLKWFDGRLGLCHVRSRQGNRLQALRQHLDQCEGVSEARLLLCPGHLACHVRS